MLLKGRKRKMFLGLFLFLIMGMMPMVNAKDSFTKALIVVDPGFSKQSMKISEETATELRTRNVKVEIVEAKQFKLENLLGVDLLVLGGPTYARQPSGKLRKAVNKINAPGLKTLLFQTGGSDCAGLEPLTAMAEEKGLSVIGSCKIVIRPNETERIGEYVDQLLASI